MRILLSLSFVAVLAALAAPSSMGTPQAGTSTLYVSSSQYGRILFAGKGRALYAFTRDPKSRSLCKGACAAAWPPFLVSGRARAGAGARARLIGTIKRGIKRQVTYAGRPLYFYVGDRSPGQVLCQNVEEFGGLWLVVRPSGRLLR